MPLVMPQYDEDQYSLDTNVLGDDIRDEEIDATIQDHRPRLLIMGMRRSGKTSIKSVVFQRMPATNTLYLESTNIINKENVTSFIDFQVWDFPGQLDYLETDTFDSNMIFGEFGALIFVIDSQDDYSEALVALVRTVEKAYRINPNLIFEVFVHKVDSLSDEYKMETLRDIQKKTTENLEDVELHNKVSLNFYLTSIYDHSIFESFSKVIQRLIPQMSTLENLLNVLCLNSGLDKAFLFDVRSKIYIATDSSPVDMQSYEICCDMIDVIFDISEIYGQTNEYQSADNDKWLERECTADASSFVKLNNDVVLCLKGVNRFLALVCLFQSDNLEKHGLIEYNFQCFKQAISNVFDLKHRGTERFRHARMETPEEDIDDDLGI